MGQNCVAGTTEFDEESGIGLVMYVESGNNMIVWKMSDGTKQGTTVPVSSDYQNKLRTAFENKTGTTIGYFIFLQYTEETINIESSITINSGDTPEEQTLFKLKASFSSYCIGKIVPGRLDFVNVWIYGPDSEHYYDVDDEGVCRGNSSTLSDRLRQELGSACEHTIDKQAENVEVEIKTIPVGSEIENWDEYQLFTKS